MLSVFRIFMINFDKKVEIFNICVILTLTSLQSPKLIFPFYKIHSSNRVFDHIEQMDRIEPPAIAQRHQRLRFLIGKKNIRHIQNLSVFRLCIGADSEACVFTEFLILSRLFNRSVYNQRFSLFFKLYFSIFYVYNISKNPPKRRVLLNSEQNLMKMTKLFPSSLFPQKSCIFDRKDLL